LIYEVQKKEVGGILSSAETKRLRFPNLEHVRSGTWHTEGMPKNMYNTELLFYFWTA
jgi:hypothetical protein